MQDSNCNLQMTEDNEATSGMAFIIREFRKDRSKSKEEKDLLKKELKKEKDRMFSLDISLFDNNMNEFEGWCLQKGQQTFFGFYRNAARGELCRYLAAKGEAWSWKSTIFPAACAGAPAFLGSVLPLLIKTPERPVLLRTTVLSIILSIVVAAVAFSYVYSELRKKRNYYETWVRHSACFYRLSLELNRFILSPRSDEDFDILKEKTFAILSQNLDQFTLNLSGNGLAKKAED